ncbi:Ribonucleotide-diphosphate reductase, gamma subunit [Bifidobacterium coryneforme]|uniref:Protein NrdI n=2 Tax=Bifidobacterium TaxID=1678 RepID=A0ABD4ABF4_9BIFI|nr:NrdI protein [Bifidobacterium coryneforme]KJY52703.1 Ribonucleotide-diphosphate reductase, gamma subunit [Bifidobacterium coryneforme]
MSDMAKPGPVGPGDQGEVSPPELAAKGDRVGSVVYFSSASQNTARFIANCHLEDEGIDVFRIPLRPKDPELKVNQPYILVVPTYGGGSAKKAVMPQIKRFLNDPQNRACIRGVIASGNTNFGDAFCMAGDIISRKCQVPFLYYFELMGTKEDEDKVRKGVLDFFHNHPE